MSDAWIVAVHQPERGQDDYFGPYADRGHAERSADQIRRTVPDPWATTVVFTRLRLPIAVTEFLRELRATEGAAI